MGAVTACRALFCGGAYRHFSAEPARQWRVRSRRMLSRPRTRLEEVALTSGHALECSGGVVPAGISSSDNSV